MFLFLVFSFFFFFQAEDGIRDVAVTGVQTCALPILCYWFATSLIAWGVLGVAGVYWSPLHWYSASTILLAAGIGCIANWLRNRSFHCVITGPLFVIAATLFLVGSLGLAHVHVSLVWSLLFVGIGVAFLLEWKYAKRS